MNNRESRSTLLFAAFVLSACDDSTADPADSLDTSADAEGLQAVYVDDDAASAGDGSANAPVRSLAEALAVAAPDATLYFRSGQYEVGSITVANTLKIKPASEGETVRFVAEPGARWAVGSLSVEGIAFDTAPEFEADSASFSEVEIVAGAAFFAQTVSLNNSRLSGEFQWQNSVAAIEFSELVGAHFVVDAADQITIENSTFSELLTDGVAVSGGHLTLRNVEFTGTTETPDGEPSAVRATAGRTVIIDSTIREFPGKAIVAVGTATLEMSNTSVSLAQVGLSTGETATVGVQRSTFEDCATLLLVGGGQVSVADSTLRNAGYGVLASGGAQMTIVDSEITDCASGPISWLGGVGGEILRNVISSGFSETCLAISASDAQISIADNDIRQCAGSGVSLLEVTQLIAARNQVSEIQFSPAFADVGEGFGIVDSTVTLEGNTISGIAGAGVNVIRSALLLDGNIISDCGDGGIRAIDSAGLSILGNDITAVRAAGVALFTSTAEVRENQISGTIAEEGLGDGLFIATNSTVTIEGNELSDNALNGLAFSDGIAGSISGNTITGNTLFGLREYCGETPSPVVVGENVFSGNGLGDAQFCEE